MKRIKDHPFQPDYAVAPGRTLRTKLKEINVSQADLASRSGLSTKHVNQIIKGIAPISQETALVLERVTGTPAGLWNRLEADYREALLRSQRRKLSDADKRWLHTFPVAELQARGYLPATREPVRLLDALLSYFGVADRKAWERVWSQPVAALKQSKAFKSEPGAVAAWLRVGELQARNVTTEPYDAAAFRASLQDARALTQLTEFHGPLVELCSAAGVVLVLATEIGDCRLSGAAWWASPERAVIQLTDRYKHEDNFWFAFFHEAAHVLLHSKKQTFLDDGSQADDLEDEANRFAASTLIPASAARQLPLLKTDAEVEQFAAEVGISPGIVVGRLHNDGFWDWSKGNRLRRHLRIVED